MIAVWDVLQKTFQPGDRVLELNCGTGEDALFLSTLGVSVVACDASERMINVATRRMQSVPNRAQIEFEACPTEHIADLYDRGPFDGLLSNFSGLNCVPDLSETAQQLARLIRPGGSLVLVLSSRFCLWESLWYFAQGKPVRAMRRWKGKATASLGNISLEVRYPTLRDIERMFRPFFALRARKGVGVTVPPSYVEALARKHPRTLRSCKPSIERSRLGLFADRLETIRYWCWRERKHEDGRQISRIGPAGFKRGRVAFAMSPMRCAVGLLREDDFPPEFLMSCTICRFQMLNEDGIWRALPPVRAAYFSRFIREYQTVRQAEGRGSDNPDYYFALPYQDLSGNNPEQWAIRSRTYRYLEQVVLPRLRYVLGRAV